MGQASREYRQSDTFGDSSLATSFTDLGLGLVVPRDVICFPKFMVLDGQSGVLALIRGVC